RLRRSRTVSESERGSAPPASCTYATRAPIPIPAHTGANSLWREQHTRGIPDSVDGSVRPSSPWRTADWPGVYGSFTTCAPGSAGRSRPRVRFTYSTSKPPDPSPSSRACVFTITSSPSSTGPVSRRYATQGRPSTSTRESPSTLSTTEVTHPGLSVSISSDVDEGERHLDHALEVLDGDPLVGGVDVLHPVREIEAGEAALVEDIRIGRAAAQRERRRVPAPLESALRDADDRVLA